MLKKNTVLCITFLLGFINWICFPASIFAQVVINEVSPISSPEWVEIYNTSQSAAALGDYSINFGTDLQTLHFCNDHEIAGGAYQLIYLSSSWLANTGDIVLLKSGDDEVDKIGYGSGYNLPKPEDATKSITRSPDGSSNWISNVQITPQGNIISFNCPTSSPSPTPTTSPSSTPAVIKSVYKINNPKDNNGLALSGVQIYVDGIYIHHEDGEIIEFFNGHECYSGVGCDLGTHTISLRKVDYSSWEDTQDFSAGKNFEVNPVLNKLDQANSTATPTTISTPTKTPKPTPTKTLLPTDNTSTTSGVLGVEADIPEYPVPTAVNEKNTKSGISPLPFILIFGGLCFIAVALFSMIRNDKKDSVVS